MQSAFNNSITQMAVDLHRRAEEMIADIRFLTEQTNSSVDARLHTLILQFQELETTSYGNISTAMSETREQCRLELSTINSTWADVLSETNSSLVRALTLLETDLLSTTNEMKEVMSAAFISLRNSSDSSIERARVDMAASLDDLMGNVTLQLGNVTTEMRELAAGTNESMTALVVNITDILKDSDVIWTSRHTEMHAAVNETRREILEAEERVTTTVNSFMASTQGELQELASNVLRLSTTDQQLKDADSLLNSSIVILDEKTSKVNESLTLSLSSLSFALEDVNFTLLGELQTYTRIALAAVRDTNASIIEASYANFTELRGNVSTTFEVIDAMLEGKQYTYLRRPCCN